MSPRGLTREQLAWCVAHDIQEGASVNLGIGIPSLVANYVLPDREVVYHSENGILGVGPSPAPGEEDWQLINASKSAVTLVRGGSVFSHVDAFAMIRGGHIDIAVMGAFQVSAEGDLANWITDENAVPAVGGAMDLAAGAKAVWAVMTHTAKTGAPKVVRRCTYPLTAPRAVRRVYTDLCILDVAPGGLVVRAVVPGLDLLELQRLTEPPLRVEGEPRTLEVPWDLA